MESTHSISPDSPAYTALLVGNSPSGCSSLARCVRAIPCQVHTASCCHDAAEVFVHNDIAVVLTDAQLADGTWRAVVAEARRLRTPPNVIVVAVEPDWRLWADVLTSGGFDVLSPDSAPDAVAWMVQSACRRWQRARDIDDARRKNRLGAELFY